MELSQVRAFVNVASLKSFSEAAEKMFISQPSVSVKIKALEEELGVVLLDRSKAREPVLTESGRIFLDYAHSMLNLHDDCREKLSGQQEQATGTVHIGASTVPGIYLLPALMVDFRHENSSVSLKVNILDTSAVLEGILNYSYELGFVGLTREDERLVYSDLVEDELVLCTRAGLLDKQKFTGGVPLDVLCEQHLILREKGSATRRLLEKKLAENLPGRNVFTETTCINNLECIKQAVIKGLGVTVISRLAVEDVHAAGAVDLFSLRGINLKRSLYLVFHRGRVLGGAAGLLRDFILKRFNR